MWSRRTFRGSGRPQAPCCKLVSSFHFAWVLRLKNILVLSPVEEDQIMYAYTDTKPATPWNKGRIIGQKPPLKIKQIWAIRVRLQLA